jgi:transposase
MAGRCRLTATAAQRAELSALTRSPDRGEADRARALLWSLDGEGSAAIGARLGVRADRVRKWRQAFARGGVAALRARRRTGRPGRRGQRALAAAAAVLDAPAPEGMVWTLPRLASAVGRATAEAPLSAGYLGWLLRRKGASAGAGRGTR